MAVNLLPTLPGEQAKSPRNFFFYFSDDGDVLAIRIDNWKIMFMEQRTPGRLDVWRDPFVKLRAPIIYNLRTDPYEFADGNVEHLQRMDDAPRLFDLCRAGRGREVRRDLQGFSRGAEAELLHH